MFEIQYDAADPDKNTFYKNKIMHCSVYALIAFYQMTKITKWPKWPKITKIAKILNLLNMLNMYISSIGEEKKESGIFFVIC